MNNERVQYLLTYLSELQRLNADSYRCNNEIAECVDWIRAEFIAYNLPIDVVTELAQKVNERND